MTQCAAVSTHRRSMSVAPQKARSKSAMITDAIQGHECGTTPTPPTIFAPRRAAAPTMFGVIAWCPHWTERLARRMVTVKRAFINIQIMQSIDIYNVDCIRKWQPIHITSIFTPLVLVVGSSFGIGENGLMLIVFIITPQIKYCVAIM